MKDWKILLRLILLINLNLGLVFASDKGGATIRVVVFVAEGLGFVVQL
jgi:hypothetical protein